MCFIFISFGTESSDDDNWMDDALLHGINAANVHVGQQVNCASVSFKNLLLAFEFC